MLDADWIADHHESFDIFHVHFGFDAKSPRELRDIAAALRDAGVPLVVTVHDLRNPHHPDAGAARRAARGPARERRRGDHADPGCGRDDRCALGPARRGPAASARRRLGHDGAAATVARRLRRRAARQEPSSQHGRGGGGAGARGDDRRAARCDGCGSTSTTRSSTLAPTPTTRCVGEALRALAATHDRVELREHDYFSDDELWEYLNAIDVSVLPYRFGTHSGWLEACFDLGTAVVAPSCGFYAEQRPCVTYRHDETGLDAASLAHAVRSAYEQSPAPRADLAERRRGTPGGGRRPSVALLAPAGMRRLRIGIIAAARFPVVEPFAGGLEAHVWGLADRLRTLGHEVTLFAGPGSDPRLGVELLDLRRPRLSDAARADVSMTAPEWLDEHHAYLQLMLRLGRSAAADFDVIHNHSLHYLPVAMAATVPVPVICTLHTPPTPWLESAIQVDEHCPATFVAVSEHTARAWSHIVPGRARDPQRRRRRAAGRPGPAAVRRSGSGGSRPRRAPIWRSMRRCSRAPAFRSPARSRTRRTSRPRSGRGWRWTASSTAGTSPTRSSCASWARRPWRSSRRVGTSPTASSSPRRSRAGRRSAPSRAARCRSCCPRTAGAWSRPATSTRSPRPSGRPPGSRATRRASTRCARCSLDVMVDRYVELYDSLAAAPVA